MDDLNVNYQYASGMTKLSSCGKESLLRDTTKCESSL